MNNMLLLFLVVVDGRCLELGPRYLVVLCSVFDVLLCCVESAMWDVLLCLSFLLVLFVLGGVGSGVLCLSDVVGVCVGVVGGVGDVSLCVVAMVSWVSSAYIVASCVSGVSVSWERESDAGSSWFALSSSMVPLLFRS